MLHDEGFGEAGVELRHHAEVKLSAAHSNGDAARNGDGRQRPRFGHDGDVDLLSSDRRMEREACQLAEQSDTQRSPGDAPPGLSCPHLIRGSPNGGRAKDDASGSAIRRNHRPLRHCQIHLGGRPD